MPVTSLGLARWLMAVPIAQGIYAAAKLNLAQLLENGARTAEELAEPLHVDPKMPSTVHGVCGVLGVTEELKTANFVKKFGGTFRWGRNKEPWTFTFASSVRFPSLVSVWRTSGDVFGSVGSALHQHAPIEPDE